MVVKAEQERVRGLIADTVTLLCRNGLQYKSKFCINALIGITLDEEDVFLVDIRETIKNAEVDVNSEADSAASDETPSKSSSRKRKRHRKRSKSNIESAKADTAPQSESASEAGSLNTGVDNEKLDNDNSSEPPEKRLVKQEEDDEDSQDLVFIKDEPADSDLSSSAFGNLSHLYQQQQSETSSGVLDSMSQQGHMYGQAQSGADGLPGPSSWGDQTFSSMQPSVQNTMPNASTSSGATDSQSQPPPVTTSPPPAAPTVEPGRRRPPRVKFCCPQCSKRLSSKEKMDEHVATHLKFACDDCLKRFPSEEELEEHVASSHKPADAVNCHQCAACFSSTAELAQHVNDTHKTEPSGSFSCPVCHAVFSSKTSLATHVRIFHRCEVTDQLTSTNITAEFTDDSDQEEAEETGEEEGGIEVINLADERDTGRPPPSSDREESTDNDDSESDDVDENNDENNNTEDSEDVVEMVKEVRRRRQPESLVVQLPQYRVTPGGESPALHHAAWSGTDGAMSGSAHNIQTDTAPTPITQTNYRFGEQNPPLTVAHSRQRASLECSQLPQSFREHRSMNGKTQQKVAAAAGGRERGFSQQLSPASTVRTQTHGRSKSPNSVYSFVAEHGSSKNLHHQTSLSSFSLPEQNVQAKSMCDKSPPLKVMIKNPRSDRNVGSSQDLAPSRKLVLNQAPPLPKKRGRGRPRKNTSV